MGGPVGRVTYLLELHVGVRRLYVPAAGIGKSAVCGVPTVVRIYPLVNPKRRRFRGSGGSISNTL